MKQTFCLLSFLILFPFSRAKAQTFTLACTDHRELSFVLNFLDNKPVSILFSASGGGSNISDDLLGTSANLKRDPLAPNNQIYVNYKGEIKLKDTDSFSRSIQVSYQAAELKKSAGIIIDMNPGDAHFNGDESSTFTEWAFECDRTK